jgi:NitT/TauT family transport system substrate-binding protein
VDEAGHVGTQTLERWQGYSGFLYEQGLLVDAAGKKLTVPPDYAALFSNDFLP